jgi:hypothetical protein
MKKYRDRCFNKISTGITIAYLSTAILCGMVGCYSHIERKELKEKYKSGEISHEYYISKGMEFNEKEESVFKCLALVFGMTYIADLTFDIVSKGKEY